jgi:hypothetical protein
MPSNSLASWSFGLGLLSVALFLLFWPASPLVALAAIVFGVLGTRAARRFEFGGQDRALIGIGYGAITLIALAVIVLVSRTS